MDSPLRLGIAGLGTVGSSLVELIVSKQDILSLRCGRDIKIEGVSARDKSKDRGKVIKSLNWYDDPIELSKSQDIDIFVELMGGEDDPSYTSVKSALSSGKSVVTANKALLAKHGFELAELAEQNNLSIFYEAAVAGSVPIIRTMRQSLGGDNIKKVLGILNGTCNYILTRMEHEGLAFQDVLTQAQELGYAEADPTFDIDGYDTAHKLSILSRLAFGEKIEKDSISVEGIRTITLEDIEAARELGYRIKLLGIAEITANGIDTRVHPTLIPLDCAISEIGGVTNMVWIESDCADTLLLSGPGAGGAATASAVIGDICDLSHSSSSSLPIFGRPISSFSDHSAVRPEHRLNEFFLHLRVPDKSGMMAQITSCMADRDISLSSIIQRGIYSGNDGNGDLRPLSLVTHLCSELSLRDAVGDMQTKGCYIGDAQVLRIEKPE